jgi:hypothetical protein
VLLEERQHRLVERLGRPQVHHVVGFDRHEPSVEHLVRDQVRGATHVGRVLRRVDDQRRHIDLAEALCRGRVERLREGLVHRHLVDVVAGDLPDARARRVVGAERRPDL